MVVMPTPAKPKCARRIVVSSNHSVSILFPPTCGLYRFVNLFFLRDMHAHQHLDRFDRALRIAQQITIEVCAWASLATRLSKRARCNISRCARLIADSPARLPVRSRATAG
jgi:hypothetical protein